MVNVMDKKTALAKIKKCLALAKSANEHEAAQALKQAQALMREFEVTEQDVEWSQVNEASQPYTNRCAVWQVGLVSMCAKAFGCNHFSRTRWDNGQYKTRINFVGIGARPELAAYAYEVLLRQVRKARSEYRKTALSRLRNTKTINYRLDAFSVGWVRSVRDLVTTFASSPTEQAILNGYMKKNYPDLIEQEVKPKSATSALKTAANMDYLHGQKAGESAQLNHAMGHSPKQLGVNHG